MSREQNEQIALQWLEGFNAHDLEKILALYDGSAEHYSPKLKIRLPETYGLIKGKDALKKWWKDAFERLPTLKYNMKKLTVDEEQVFIEYVRQVKGEEDMNVAEVLQIKNGLIVFSRVYHG